METNTVCVYKEDPRKAEKSSPETGEEADEKAPGAYDN
jgi:hypothetical protein